MFDIGIFATVASNTSLATVENVAANTAQSTVDNFTGFIVAISTLVSTLSGILAFYIQRPKVKSAVALAGATADKVIQHSNDIKTVAKVTYDMLPEQAAKIIDAQNVRLAALEEKANAANAELSKLKKDADKTI